MIGDTIRAYREFKGLTQVQLAELSEINVGTIRKYELGLRKPKPEQLEKIASSMGLNVSIFLDFNIETVGDVLSLLFAIDDSVDMILNKTDDDQNVIIEFKNKTMQEFLLKWCQFKNIYEKEKHEIEMIEDAEKRQTELEKLEKVKQEWQLRAMGTTIGCHTIVKKGSDNLTIRLNDLT